MQQFAKKVVTCKQMAKQDTQGSFLSNLAMDNGLRNPQCKIYLERKMSLHFYVLP
jgi:hypothetical protein